MEMIPQFEPLLGKEEISNLTECISDNWITGGQKVKEFQDRVATRHRVKYAEACCNGTMALFIAIESLKRIYSWPPGFEVIVPDFTFIASANAVVLAGGKPVFCDIEAKKFNINPNEIPKLITKNTKAIMPVHIFGQSAEMDFIIRTARLNNLCVIEDAAQGIGVTYKGTPVGGLGHVGIISFYADKTITSAEGGMVLTNDPEIKRQATILNNQGRTGRGFYQHDYIGYNFRMSDLHAAVGLAQLDKLDYVIKRKKYVLDIYRCLLYPTVEFPYVDPEGVPFRINIIVNNPEKLQKFLEENGVQTRRWFYPIHKQSCYYTGTGTFPETEKAYMYGLSLPSSVKITDCQIEYVADKIKEYIDTIR